MDRMSLDFNNVALPSGCHPGEHSSRTVVLIGWRLHELAKVPVVHDERITQVLVEVGDGRANADRVAALPLVLRQGADIRDAGEKGQAWRFGLGRRAKAQTPHLQTRNQDRPGHPDEHGG